MSTRKEKKLAPDKDDQEIVFVDQPPARGEARRGWFPILEPLLLHPNRWARIFVADNPDQAANAASNMNKRNVRIPNPDHVWEFAARGSEIYAIYRGGPKRRRHVRTTG